MAACRIKRERLADQRLRIPGSPAVSHALPLVYAVLLWFVGTGAVLWLDRRPARTHKLSLAAATLAAVLALWCLDETARSTSSIAAFAGFTCALVVWSMHELAFLTGTVMGPRRAALPPGTTGFRRFRLAALTLIHHEIALALTLALIAGLTWHQPNQTGTLAFATLFAMRLSAKLNIFIGLPHVSTEMLPETHRYLVSYYGRARVNLLFPQSLVACCATAYLFARAAFVADTEGAQTTYILVFGLTLLGLIEHTFLALPLRDARLWRWAMPDTALVPVNMPSDGRDHD